MKLHAWKFAVFGLLVLTAVVCSQLGRVGWFEAFIDNRIFSVPFGILDWAQLISWCFEFLFFFACGVLVAGLFIANGPRWWGFAFGLICGLLHFLGSGNGFTSNATWSTYFWAYGVYLVPALGAFVGASASHALSVWHARDSCPTIHSSGRAARAAKFRR